MAEEILIEQAERIRRHPWWLARASLTLRLLERLDIKPPARVIDVGCGWGVTLKALETRGFQVTGLDISPKTLEMLDAEQGGRSLVEADLTYDWPDSFIPFDAVLALDVIEHLDDDRAAVRRLTQLIKPGGVLIVSVPALPELFSEFDRIQGHRRRYVPETFQPLFDHESLEHARIFWWGSWMLPLLRRQRRQPRETTANESTSQLYQRYLHIPSWPASLVMAALFAREQKSAIAGRLKIGTSLFAVARRVNQQS